MLLGCRLLEVSSPLEDSIRHELSSRDPAADDWLWLQQHPLTVSNFVSILEGGNQLNTTSTYMPLYLSFFTLLFNFLLQKIVRFNYNCKM